MSIPPQQLKFTGSASTLALAALAALLASACAVRQAPPAAAPPALVDVRGTHEAAAAFEEARALYDLGRFDDAAVAFQIMAAEFPYDPILPHVELYLGRSLVAAGRAREGELVWSSLAEDPAWHDVATLYLAWLDREQGDTELSERRLRELLHARPSLRISMTLTVPGDEPLLAALLAQARIRQGAFVDALVDLDLAYHVTANDAHRQWALALGTQIVEQELSPRQWRELADSEAALSRALALPRLAEEALSSGDADRAREWMEAWGPEEGAIADPEEIVALQIALMAGERGRARSYGAVLSFSGADRRASRAVLGSFLLVQRVFEAAEPASLLLLEDASDTPEQTAAAVRRLHSRGALAIIGPLDRRLEAAARDEAHRLGMLYIGLGPLPWTDRVDGSWRLQVDAVSEARIVLEEAALARGATRFVVIEESPQPAWLRAFSDAAQEQVNTLGGQVVEVLSIDVGADTQEAAAAVARGVVASDADAIIMALSEDSTTALVAHLAHQGIWPHPGSTRSGDRRRRMHYLGNSLMLSDSLLRNSAEYLVGALMPIWFDPSIATGRAASFALRFGETFGREPGPLEAFAYDAAWILRQIIVAEGLLEPRALAARPGQGQGWDGVTGRIDFDELGNVVGTPTLATVREGRLVRR